jgi:Kef-type K+ transport system membrane component KefB
MDKTIKNSSNATFGSSSALLHPVETEKTDMRKIIAAVVLIIIAGIGSGYAFSRVLGSNKSQSQVGTTAQTGEVKKVVVGSTDANLLRDSAEGTLEANGLKGEGTHKLIRPGGDSQTVYLMSSMLDLSLYVGKKIRVSGQTYAGKQVEWLMDVGKIEVLE